MEGQLVGRGPKKSVNDDDFPKRRRPQESGGATARSVSPRVAGSNTRCLTPRDAGEPEEDARTPDGSGAAADGNPTPEEASRRSSGGPGGSVVDDNDGEGSGGRAEAEVRGSADSPGGTLDSAASGPSASDSYVKVAETSCRAGSSGEGTPEPVEKGSQCSWGLHTDGRVPPCSKKPRYALSFTCLREEAGGIDREELGDWRILCPLHAATASYVMMGKAEVTLRQWCEDVCG